MNFKILMLKPRHFKKMSQVWYSGFKQQTSSHTGLHKISMSGNAQLTHSVSCPSLAEQDENCSCEQKKKKNHPWCQAPQLLDTHSFLRSPSLAGDRDLLSLQAASHQAWQVPSQKLWAGVSKIKKGRLGREQR